jgi:hypothetical protein
MSEQPEQQQVVVVGADGQPVGTVSVGSDGSVEPSKQQSPADMIEQPAKVMRIGSMVKQLLEEVRSAPLDDASRLRLFHGIQTALFAQQMAARVQLEQMRGRTALPPGSAPQPPVVPGGTGQYL